MNILVLDEWLPSKCDSGKSIRSFQLLAPLARKHRITYLANRVEGDEEVRIMEDAGFEVVCVPRRKIYGSIPAIAFGALPALFDPLPISVRRHFSPDFSETMRRLVGEKKFDLVHVEWTHYAIYGNAIRELPQFVCTHNVEYLSWRRSVTATRNPLEKLLGIHEAEKMYRFEKRIYRSADYLSVVSENDAGLLENEFGIKEFCIIPNGVEIEFYDEIPNAPKPNRLVYCGSMDASVNQDAVLWFISEVFPLILKKRPDAEFVVIGRNPPDWLIKYQNQHIRFTGAVDDIRLPLKEGMVEVVPLRIGGGTRLKILEAFAARIPVVSTTIGAEGLNIENEKNLLLADTSETFAAQCLKLLESPELASRLADEGRFLVDGQYDWSRISPLVEAAWHRTIELRGKKTDRPT